MGTAHEGSADPFLFNDDSSRLIVGPLPKHALRPRGRQGKTETIFQAWSTECHRSGTMKTQAAGRGTGHAPRVHVTPGRGTIHTHANTLRPDTTHPRALRDLSLKERRGRCGDQRERLSLKERLSDLSALFARCVESLQIAQPYLPAGARKSPCQYLTRALMTYFLRFALWRLQKRPLWLFVASSAYVVARLLNSTNPHRRHSQTA